MSQTSENSKRIAKNTLFLYFRTFIIMAVSVFTSRLILNVLGVEDYGIYNVVGGIVVMFSLLSGTLTAATQRFITFELGKEKPESNKVFSAALEIHVLLALVIFILLESVGCWFLNNKMNIDPIRLSAANWVFQCSTLTFCINLVSIPYNVSIIAHEKMSAFAYISIFEAIVKLGFVYLLLVIIYDKLIVYALLMLVVSIMLRLIYGVYCKRNFVECQFHIVKNKILFREMLSFSGWNFIGSTAGMLNTQGINILINLFFGVALNAARGVAEQLNAAVNSFVMNFMTAVNPQITKNFASGNYKYLNSLIVKGMKYSFFLFWLFCLPLFFETEFVLNLWLIKVPQESSVLLRYALVFSCCQLLSQTLYTAMLATGNIKKYQIVVGLLSIMAFPVAYLFFFCGLPVEFGYISSIIFSLLCLIARLYLLKDMIPQFSILSFCKDGLFKIILVILLSVILLTFVKMCIQSLQNKMISFLIILCLSIFITGVSTYIVGLTKSEKRIIKKIIENKIKK